MKNNNNTNMTTKTAPIGQLKSKTTICCTICGFSHKRNFKINVYENTPEAIEKAKAKLTKKATKEYTCRICKTITKELNKLK